MVKVLSFFKIFIYFFRYFIGYFVLKFIYDYSLYDKIDESNVEFSVILVILGTTSLIIKTIICYKYNIETTETKLINEFKNEFKA